MKHRLIKATNGAVAVSVVGLPVSESDLEAIGPFEFQNWVIQRIHGTPSPRKSGDRGIDGYSFMEQLPVQVKQSRRVGRNVIDNFQTAVRRSGKHKGFLIAFSFSRGARAETARARLEDGIEIELVEVCELLDEPAKPRLTPTLERLFPQLPQSLLDLPLPPPRPRAARPSPSELIDSALHL